MNKWRCILLVFALVKVTLLCIVFMQSSEMHDKSETAKKIKSDGYALQDTKFKNFSGPACWEDIELNFVITALVSIYGYFAIMCNEKRFIFQFAFIFLVWGCFLFVLNSITTGIIKKKYNINDYDDNLKKVFDRSVNDSLMRKVEYRFHCCGVHGPRDYENFSAGNDGVLPHSCCVDVYEYNCSYDGSWPNGCGVSIVNYLYKKTLVISTLSNIANFFKVIIGAIGMCLSYVTCPYISSAN